MNKFKYMVKSEIDYIIQNANFTDEQYAVFRELTKSDYGITKSDISIYMKLHMSATKFYKIKKEIKNKIDKVLFNP